MFANESSQLVSSDGVGPRETYCIKGVLTPVVAFLHIGHECQRIRAAGNIKEDLLLVSTGGVEWQILSVVEASLACLE